MSLTKEQKNQVVSEISELLAGSKMTVLAKYQGTSVQAMQALRRQANEVGTTVKVVKNRLVKKALEQSDKFKAVDTAVLEGMIMYAFNAEDEAAPAQTLANSAKDNPAIEFVGAITADGQLLSAEDVKALAALPSKDQLRGQLVGVLATPLSGLVGVMSGNLRGIMNVLSAHAESLGEA